MHKKLKELFLVNHHHLAVPGQLQLLFCFLELASDDLWGLGRVGLVMMPALQVRTDGHQSQTCCESS